VLWQSLEALGCGDLPGPPSEDAAADQPARRFARRDDRDHDDDAAAAGPAAWERGGASGEPCALPAGAFLAAIDDLAPALTSLGIL